MVSVVIPCHNYGAFLAEAIESALAQTHRPLEVIVVDDGSTDNTAAVAGRYPIRVVSQQRLGVCVASNNGIRASSGEYVLRLDADDVLEPTYVEETLAALKPQPRAGFAYTEFTYFGAASGSYPVEEFDPDSLAERNYIHASALMRRDAFEAVGGYDPALAGARCEDWDLWLACADRQLYGVFVRRPLLRYRLHPTSSRNTLAWRSPALWRRNLVMAARLQDNHPRLFATPALMRRVLRLPSRLLRKQVSVKFAALLVSFYGAMLVRDAWRSGRSIASKTRRGTLAC
jgi:glycosyltransferase involved in cell wall biosynthesis